MHAAGISLDLIANITEADKSFVEQVVRESGKTEKKKK